MFACKILSIFKSKLYWDTILTAFMRTVVCGCIAVCYVYRTNKWKMNQIEYLDSFVLV